MEDRLERPIERLTHQINILGEKIRGTQSIIPSDGGSTFKKEEGPVLTPREKSRERQKAIEFGKALGIGNYAPQGKLEDLTPTAIKPNVAAATAPAQKDGGVSILGMIGKVIGTIFKVLNYAALYKLAKPFIEKFFGKNVITDTIFGIFDPIIAIIDDLKKMFVNWFKKTFPNAYKVIVSVIDTVKSAFSWVWEKIKGAYNWVKSFFEAPDKKKFLLDTWDNIKKTISDMFNPEEGKETMWGVIKEKLISTYNSIKEWIDEKLNAFTGVFNAFNRGVESITKLINTPDVQAIIANFRKLSDWISQHGEFLGKSALSIVASFDQLGKDISAMVKEFREEIWPKLKEELIGIIKEQLSMLRERLAKVTEEKLNEITKTIKTKLGAISAAVISEVRRVGAAIRAALSGISGAVRRVEETAVKLGDAADQVKKDSEEVGKAAKSVKDTADRAKDIMDNPGQVVKDVVIQGGKEMLKEAGKQAVPAAVKTAGALFPGAAQGIKAGKAIYEGAKEFFGGGSEKKADDFLVSKRGDFVNFSSQDNVLGFKDGGSIDRVLGKKDDALITDTRQILIESRKQVSLLQKIVENTYNANLLLQKLNNKPAQQPSNMNNGTRGIIKFNRSEFDIETSPAFNFANNLATI